MISDISGIKPSKIRITIESQKLNNYKEPGKIMIFLNFR